MAEKESNDTVQVINERSFRSMEIIDEIRGEINDITAKLDICLRSDSAEGEGTPEEACDLNRDLARILRSLHNLGDRIEL